MTNSEMISHLRSRWPTVLDKVGNGMVESTEAQISGTAKIAPAMGPDDVAAFLDVHSKSWQKLQRSLTEVHSADPCDWQL